MSLRDFIDQLEELEDEYGDLELPWKLVREKPDEITDPRSKEEVAEHITIDMGYAHAAKLPIGDSDE